MRLPNGMYDILKWICLIFFPALCVLLAATLPVFGVSGDVVKCICVVITAIQTFIGSLIGISTTAYNAEVKNNE